MLIHLRFPISTTSPFAYDLALEYLRTSPATIIEAVTEDTYRRAIRLNGKPVLLTVRPVFWTGMPVDEENRRAGQLMSAPRR